MTAADSAHAGSIARQSYDRRRIAITGMGSINALGRNVEELAHGLRTGRCAIRTLSVLAPDAGFHSNCAAEVDDVTLPAGVSRPLARRASRSTKLALIAAAEAWKQAALPAGEASQAAIVLGTTTGGIERGERIYQDTLAGRAHKWRTWEWLESPVATVADSVAQALGCSGSRMTLSTACSSSALALGMAADWIESGRAETVLCGGVDALCLMTYSGFDALHALDPSPCKPFDKRRAGLTLGEAAAFFVFEDWQHALDRGAHPLAEFLGYGASADAHHLTQPRADSAGPILAMKAALKHAGLAPEEIDYINAHGTGTPLNDVAETRAIKEVFGAHAYRIPVSSTKSMHGHCLAAAGAIEAAASVIAIRERFVPPTASLRDPDPECDLDFVPGESRAAELRTVMSNSYGFGGNNASLVIRAADA